MEWLAGSGLLTTVVAVGLWLWTKAKLGSTRARLAEFRLSAVQASRQWRDALEREAAATAKIERLETYITSLEQELTETLDALDRCEDPGALADRLRARLRSPLSRLPKPPADGGGLSN